jgi:hypothetical protein
MGNLILILVGLLIGVAFAFFLSTISTEWGYAFCIVAVVIILTLIGPELLPLIRKAPAGGGSWSYYDSDDEDDNPIEDI